MTEILPASKENIALAARSLRAGRLVAFPTETVYGLGGNALDDHAVAAIYAAKNRPDFNPLIVHLPGLDMAAQFVHITETAKLLARRFWPGPLTLILPRLADCRLSLLLSAGLETVAIRAPHHPVAQALLTACGFPLAGPSANPSGRISPTRPEHVVEGLDGKIDYVLDGGACKVGVESSVLDLSGTRPALLRPGAILADEIAAVLGEEVVTEQASVDSGARKSPGQLSSHYAPHLPVRLNAVGAEPGEILIAFGPVAPADAANLSTTGDLTEAAANLFAYLRAADQPGYRGIAIMPIPETGLGIAINDRLRRAAAPR
ncbi:MAG TPA: L-threonylcarbamoyladenylate synthase [Terriglobia bacterium]|nr:L-threonylcarbamoyladenylate synthase [Terriglobia bacterium]